MSDHALRGKNCTVLGAGGFIGTNLTQALVGVGARVTGFGRRARVDTASGIGWIDGDFDRAGDVVPALAGADVVFHLLGGSNPAASNQRPGLEIRRMLAGNLRLIEAAVEAGVGRLVFVSSGGAVYGPQARLPIAEDAPTDPISAYGIGKLATEKLLGLYRLIGPLDHAVLRVANPFGPGQLPDRPQGVIATMIRRALDGRPIDIWGDGSVVRDYLHVADVCDALLRAAVADSETRVFNIGSGVGRSLASVAGDIARVLGRPLDIRYQAARPADIPANVLDIARADRELGWRPAIDWEAALADTAAWLAAPSPMTGREALA